MRRMCESQLVLRSVLILKGSILECQPLHFRKTNHTRILKSCPPHQKGQQKQISIHFFDYNQLLVRFKSYLQDLQPTYIGVRIHPWKWMAGTWNYTAWEKTNIQQKPPSFLGFKNLPNPNMSECPKAPTLLVSEVLFLKCCNPEKPC